MFGSQHRVMLVSSIAACVTWGSQTPVPTAVTAVLVAWLCRCEKAKDVL